MKNTFVLAIAAVLSAITPAQSVCPSGDIQLGIVLTNQVRIFDADCAVIDQTQPGQTAACNNGFEEGSHIDCNNGFISLVTTPNGEEFSGCSGTSNSCGYGTKKPQNEEASEPVISDPMIIHQEKIN
ncbi:hypothetical protein SCHPADRAFT_895354 [Schizopora paradoxa]|uniref:Cyanovirin-N domain-containing protein n=1 Tax=Schizopora paradoxa TaxID=27342 RepID=A0A0H2R5A4_9AGAM|nr:hypothetical protein SCHPADRAFT_895354 [Schizopora paradoxa]